MKDETITGRLVRLVRERPGYRDTLEKIVKWYDENFKCEGCGSRNLKRVGKHKYKCTRCGYSTTIIGFHTMDIQAIPAYLVRLANMGILEVTYRSSAGGVYYMPKDIDVIKRVLRLSPREIEVPPPRELNIPDDLFEPIVGYDDLKGLLIDCLKKRVHVLLVGPPSTAKSMILQEIARIDGSYFALAGTSTKAGLRDVIVEERPSILIIDELDKIYNPNELSILLTLMESGFVTVTIHGRRERVYVNTIVFAGANTTRNIPPELLSRFLVIRLRPYTEEEFREIVVNVLVRREGISEDVAKYIADRVIEMGSRDPRDAIKIARLSGNDKGKVDNIIRVLEKYEDSWRV